MAVVRTVWRCDECEVDAVVLGDGMPDGWTLVDLRRETADAEEAISKVVCERLECMTMLVAKWHVGRGKGKEHCNGGESEEGR